MTATPAPPVDASPDSGSERIVDVELTDEMQGSFLEYAYSVIYSRALPDARDGLKPVQRRIIYQMSQMGLTPEKGHVKSARVVGDVMGKLHPHGDSAIYDALVRLSQSFSMRVPMIDGHGNFGSLDDGPAAARYTEARLMPAAIAMVENLDEDVVDFIPNYDNQLTQPSVLPAALPHLLINGASGIAVGMATSIPSHNAAEIIDAAMLLIENPQASHDQLMEIVRGPDFATGGVLVDSPSVISAAYASGRGAMRVRARFSNGWQDDTGWEPTGVEKLPGGTWQLVVSEIPYQVQKGKLIEQIAQLIADKKLPILDDIRDESDEHVRIVLVPKSRNVDPEDLKNALFRLTDLETRFSLNMNVLDADRTPKVMGLGEVLLRWLAHSCSASVSATAAMPCHHITSPLP